MVQFLQVIAASAEADVHSLDWYSTCSKLFSQEIRKRKIIESNICWS